MRELILTFKITSSWHRSKRFTYQIIIHINHIYNTHTHFSNSSPPSALKTLFKSDLFYQIFSNVLTLCRQKYTLSSLLLIRFPKDRMYSECDPCTWVALAWSRGPPPLQENAWSQGPCARKAPILVLGLPLCCCHLEILNDVWTKGPMFSLCTGPCKSHSWSKQR